MTDTKRTLAEILTLLADNVTGNISEQDIRDAIVTIHGGHGELTITSAAETTIPDTVTWVMDAGVWAIDSDPHQWDMNTNGQLRYTGAPTRTVFVTGSMSMIAAASNKVYSIGVAKNGTIIDSSIMQRKIGTAADVGMGNVQAHVNVDTNDYLTLVVKGETDDTNITFTHGNLFASDVAQ